MGWNSRWSSARDDDGWRTVRRSRWGNDGGSRRRSGSPADGKLRQLQHENESLRKKVSEAERVAAAAADRTKHPSARDNAQRHGDWMCFPCGFKSNRAYRGYCYRCAEPKSVSCGAPSGLPSAACGEATATTTTPTSTTLASTTTLTSSADAIKGIKQRIASLEAARTALAGAHDCNDEKERIEQGITAARAALSVHLPVEVAVRTTIGPTQQARAAVSKAEAKLAKVESQISALVDQHNAAAAELATSRAKLAEAEAATAKAASAALPSDHYRSALAADPGAFWTAFKAVILQRCPGFSQETVGQLDAATKAFEAAVTPVFAHAAAAGVQSVPAAPTAGVGRPLSNPPPPVLAPFNGSAAVDVPTAESASPSASTNCSPASAEDIIAQAMSGQPCQSQHHQPPPTAAGAAAAVAAAAEITRVLQAASATAAATPLESPAAEHIGGPLGDTNGRTHDAQHGGGGGGDEPAIADDAMGGGAANNLANKRSADALASARNIAAKAKARAGA